MGILEKIKEIEFEASVGSMGAAQPGMVRACGVQVCRLPTIAAAQLLSLTIHCLLMLCCR